MAKNPHALLKDGIAAMEEVVHNMLAVKKEGSKSRGKELSELGTQASLLFLELRAVNRTIFREEDGVKQETEAAKVPVDHITLSLHNLLYEKNHYLKAMKTCRDFKSKYPAIQLVTQEDFCRDAPDDMKLDVNLTTDNHKLMLKRLHFELYQRKKLCRRRETLEAHKKQLQECIASRKKFISTLPTPLKGLKRASVPLQQLLGIAPADYVASAPLLHLLPPPLYILYSHLAAHKENLAEPMTVEILGNAREAHDLSRQLAKKEVEDDTFDEGDQRRRSRSHRKSAKTEVKPAVDVYKSHPLRICLTLYYDGGKLVTLLFEHVSKLNIVCAGIEGAQEESENLLHHLYPGDKGLEFPNQVSKVIAGEEFRPQHKPGLRPYKWAQQLTGIDCMPEIPPLLQLGGTNDAGLGSGVDHPRVTAQSLIKLIRLRVTAQLAESKPQEDVEMLQQ